MERLKPLNDFIFKKIFGEKQDEPILISFLNAVLSKTQEEKLVEIEIIDNKELDKQLLEDKTGRIDVRARTSKGEQIDIEVQLTNQSNMDRRTLFYWSKLYLEGIKKGQDYKNLNKVITINILDFNYLDTKNYHTSFHLWEDSEKDYMLTDIVEIHFIELPKFKLTSYNNYKHEILPRWLTFLQKDVSDDILEELINMEPAIKMAEQKLDMLSSDPLTIELYKAREYSEHERANIYSSGVDEGYEKGLSRGIMKEKINITISLLDVLDIPTIASKVGLSIEEVEKIKKEHIRSI